MRLCIFNLVQFLLYFNRRGPSAKTLSALRNMKGTKKGMKALVLGNGPSLGKINIDNIRQTNPDIFVVNSFNQMDLASKIKPDYYCLSDPDSIIEPERPVPHDTNSTIEYITKNECTLITSHFYRKIQLPQSMNRIYFNDKEFTLFGMNLNPCFPRGYSSITILKTIAVALYMGYDKIYLLGVDNTEFKSLVGDIDNHTLIDTSNLYDKGSVVAMKYIFGSAGGIAGQFLQYATWFGDFAKFPRDRIINLNTESLIDVFPKQHKIT